VLGERLLRIGVPLAVAAVALQTVAHLTNEFLLDDRVEGLDADIEGNVFTWASSVSTFTLAVAAFLHALAFSTRRREFGLLAGLGLLFSLDDAVQLHERVALELGEDLLGLPDYVAVRLWLVFYLPLLLLAGLLLWRFAEEVWEPAGRMLRLGLLLLVASIPVEIVGAGTRWLDEEGTSVPEDFRVVVEEGLELGGWILAAVGLMTAVVVALMGYRPLSARR
jgi:mannose/fructose/N-acetylgalactosamine-specific phosphotransferase system component IIC